MAPNTATIAAILKQTVHYHLDNLSHDNALFFAERLHAHDPRSGESSFLLALCHFRLDDYRSACEVSKQHGYRGVDLGCAYIFAQACLALERFKDGITALEKSRSLWANKSHIGKHSATSRVLYPDSAAVGCLLGKLYRAYGDKKKAIACFEDALKTNPFMWDAFAALCDIGVSVRIPNIFKTSETLARSFDPVTGGSIGEHKEGLGDTQLKKTAGQTLNQDLADPFDLHRRAAFQDIPTSNMLIAEPGENDLIAKIAAARSRLTVSSTNGGGMDGMETPTGSTPIVESIMPRNGLEPPQAPTRKTRAAPVIDAGFLDAPPRMTYRAGSKRRDRPQDSSADLLSDSTSAILRSSTLSVPPAERKRTLSGQPVQPRQTQMDDTSVPQQRRSARLNVFPRANAIKANSGASTIGAAASRELKKARPPISRILRPGSSGSSVGRVVSGNRKPMLEENGMDVDQAEASRSRESTAQPPVPPKPAEPDSVKVDEALKWILDLLKKLGSGYALASQFQSQEAIQAFSSLPRTQHDSPWVLAQLGRAHYEQANYVEAEKFFRRLRVFAPTRLEDMEVYSTILWFLKRETDLSFLAHELVDSAWHSPQAWCALGNAWSLALDHEQALRCFKRATQLDPKFAYAYTLQGHEHVLNEEYDKALTAYRQAISADRRHYNAYYGIGKVYEKLGTFDKAFSHYEAASAIHPTNAVLICCLGNVLEKQKSVARALPYFAKASDLAPNAPLTRFKKARALLALGKLDEAHKELMALKDLAPDEARVHFLLGRLYKKRGDKKSAVRHFTTALSLDPKASQQIKEAIESLEDEDSIDDSMVQ